MSDSAWLALCYGLACTGALWALKVWGERRARRVTTATAQRARRGSAAGLAGPYRGQPDGPARLMFGSAPGREDCLAIALLRGGHRAVAETLVVAALAEGWLARGSGGFSVHKTDATGLLSGALANEIRAGAAVDAAEVRRAADAAAVALQPDLRADLERAGLLRDAEALRARRVPIVRGGSLLVLGFIPAAAVAPTSALPLAVAAVLVGGAVAVLGARARQTRRGAAYLRWVDHKLFAVRADVLAQRPTQPWHVAAVVAAGGLAGVPMGLFDVFESGR